jgi:hypothetical protein
LLDQPKRGSSSIVDSEDPYYCMQAAYDSSAGTAGIRLNGEEFEINRHSITALCKHALTELSESLKETELFLIKRPEKLNESERQIIEDLIQKAIMTITCTNNLVAVYVKEYKFSWKRIWKQHLDKLINKKYVKNFNQ